MLVLLKESNIIINKWDHFGEKGPSAYIIHSTRNRNVMANIKFRALQLHDRYSDSQCVREDISDF